HPSAHFASAFRICLHSLSRTMMNFSGIADSFLLAGVIPTRTRAWTIDGQLILHPFPERPVFQMTLPLALAHLAGAVAGEQHLELSHGTASDLARAARACSPRSKTSSTFIDALPIRERI